MDKLSDVIPEEINFIVHDEMGPLGERIVYFVFYSKDKNNYTVGPSITNYCGEVKLRKQSVEEVVLESQCNFPMDYCGGLNNCNLLSVVFESKAELEKRVARLSEFYPEHATYLADLVSRCTNGTEGIFKEFCLPINEEVIDISFE